MRTTMHGFILFVLLCEFQSQSYPDMLKISEQILDESVDSKQESNTIKIGVILDAESWMGKVVNSCLTMAISDFYMHNGGYKTRIALETRDTRGDPLRSVASAFDLLDNAEVHAIIVPEISSEEHFLATLCDKANVPLLSFSSLSSFRKHHYFLQIAQDETLEFKGIAAFLRAFKWKTAVVIYEDTIDLRQILSYLHDALPDNDMVAIKEIAITLNASDHHIMKKLHTMSTTSTSIIIVHASVSLASNILVNAKILGMVNEDYAWIITSKTMSLLDIQDSAVFDSMAGVVGFKPYTPESSKLQDFTLRWRREFQHGGFDTESRGLNVFGIWAYDAIWALAEATERARTEFITERGVGSRLNMQKLDNIRVFNSGSTLLNEISSSNFTGLGGEFQLTNAKLVRETYEILNVIGKGGRRVGFWTPACGLTKEVYLDTNSCLSEGLETIIWPGFSTTVPKGRLAQRLRIGIPANTRFHELVEFRVDGETRTATVHGFCMDVFNAAIQRLQYSLVYEFVPYYNHNGSYNDLIYEVYLQNFDVAVGDITITSNRSQYVDFTLPFTEFGVGMVAPLDYKDPWFFLKPLSMDLWIISAGFFILTGFIVWLIEHHINVEFQGPLAWQIGTIFWFAVSTIVYAQREKLQSNLSRFVVGVWLFAVLILTSSYVANLSSLLTIQQIRLTKNDYIGYSANSPIFGLVVNNLNFQDNRLKPYNSREEYDEALRKGSKKGGVGAIIEEIPYIKLFLAQYPHDFAMIDSWEKTNGFAFAFQKGSPLVPDMSRAIARLREEGRLLEMEKKWFRSQSSSLSQDTETPNVEPPKTSPLGSERFSGLFLVTAISEAVALLLFLIFVLREKLSLGYYIVRVLAGGELMSILKYLFLRMANKIGVANGR